MTALPSPAAGRLEGGLRRDTALARLRLHRAPYVRRVQRAMLRLLLDNGPSTIDPIRAVVPIPDGIDPRLVGAAVRSVAELGLIYRAGMSRSMRPAAHRRDLLVRAVSDRDAVLAWLSTHPELPTVEPEQLTFWDYDR
jgi:hypothetical protein